MIPRRGEIWLVDLGATIGREQAGRRPAVVASADSLNEGGAGVTVVVPCTTRFRGLPSHIEIQPGITGLDRKSYAKCEDLRSVSLGRLISRIGAVDTEVMSHIATVLRYLLDL